MESNEIQGPSSHVEFREDILEMNLICRLCGNPNDKVVAIYSEEGVSNDLAYKINEYLPIKVSESDHLPLQCCWGCATTLLAWHELVLTVVAADTRFQEYVGEKPVIVDVSFNEIKDFHAELPNRMGPEPLPTSLNDFCQTTADEADTEPTSSLIDTANLIQKKQDKISRPKKKLNTFYPSSSDASFDTYMNDIGQQFISDNLDGEPPEYNITDEKKICIKTDNIDEEYEEEDEEKECNFDYTSCSDGEKSQKVLGCPCCFAVFVTRQDAIKHITSEHPGNECTSPVPHEIPEPKSIKKERRKNNKLDQDATNAAKLVVDGRIYYNCKECGKSLHSPYTYIWHMRIHTGERPYVCDLCGKQFRVSQGLVRHLRETHQGIKKFPCDLCGRMFATRRNVEEHRRIHTNERPYICDLCGKSFKQKASLFVHKRSHKNYFPYKCSYCDQGFRTKPPLMVHITRHTGEKPYKCETCGRCFRIKYELKRHRLIHSDEKPFSCVMCGLSFRQKRYLRNHMKSNHNMANIPIHQQNVVAGTNNVAIPNVENCASFELKDPLEIPS